VLRGVLHLLRQTDLHRGRRGRRRGVDRADRGSTGRGLDDLPAVVALQVIADELGDTRHDVRREARIRTHHRRLVVELHAVDLAENVPDLRAHRVAEHGNGVDATFGPGVLRDLIRVDGRHRVVAGVRRFQGGVDLAHGGLQVGEAVVSVGVHLDPPLQTRREQHRTVGADDIGGRRLDLAQFQVLAVAEIGVQDRGHPAHRPVVTGLRGGEGGVVGEVTLARQVPVQGVGRGGDLTVGADIVQGGVQPLGLQAVPGGVDVGRGVR